jgi:hypothetical protein
LTCCGNFTTGQSQPADGRNAGAADKGGWIHLADASSAERALRARANSNISFLVVDFSGVQLSGIEMKTNKVLFAGLALLAMIAASDAGWARSSQPADGTRQQRMDCADDARFVCSRFIPDVDRITQCMTANRRQLSPQCRRHFQ